MARGYGLGEAAAVIGCQVAGAAGLLLVIVAQVIGGTLGTALAVLLYPAPAGQPATVQEPARLAG